MNEYDVLFLWDEESQTWVAKNAETVEAVQSEPSGIRWNSRFY